MRTFEGSLDASKLHVAVVVSRFNELITEKLLQGAVDTAREHGVADHNLDVVWVPGAFELPMAARALAETGRYDAIACVGAVIRGETPHFDFIAQACANGIVRAAQMTGVPIAFGVLTTNTAEEAMARAGDGAANKGRESADAVAEMIGLYARLGASGRPAGGTS